MNLHGVAALATLVAASIALFRRWLPPELVGLAVPVTLFATRTLPAREALSGFGNPAVVTIGAILVIGAGLHASGVATLLARAVEHAGRGGRARLVVVLMATSIAMSSIMSTVAVVAILAPACIALARRADHPASRLLLPLSFGAALGCNLLAISSVSTMIVTEWGREHGAPLGMATFLPGGLGMAIAGLVAMVVLVLPRLPDRRPEDALRKLADPEAAAATHGLDRALHRLRVLPASAARGRTIAELDLRGSGLDALAVRRAGRFHARHVEPLPDLVVRSGDDLFVEGDDEAAFLVSERLGMQLGLAGSADVEDLLGHGILLAEITPAPHSPVVGRSVRQLELRRSRNVNAVSLWRTGKVLTADLADLPLQPGDAILVSGSREAIGALAEGDDFVVLTEHARSEDLRRAPLAVALLLLAVVPPMIGVMPLALSALAAAVLMVATRCIPMAHALRAIELRVLLLTVGMLPLGIALERHGVAVKLAQSLVGVASPLGTVGVLAAVFALAMTLALLTTNSTAAAVLAPMAATLSAAASLPITAVLLAIAYGANTTILHPFSAANLLVMGAGGYQPKDVVKAGAIVTAFAMPPAIVAAWLVTR